MSKRGVKRGPYLRKIFEERLTEVAEKKITHANVLKKLKRSILSRTSASSSTTVTSASHPEFETEQVEERRATVQHEKEDNDPVNYLYNEDESQTLLFDDSEQLTYTEETTYTYRDENLSFHNTDDDDITAEGIELPEETDADDTLLYPGARITVGAFMLLMALFFTKHNCVGDAVQQLLNIVAYILPEGNKVCSSLHEFKMYFSKLKNPLQYHYYCPKCFTAVKDKSLANCEKLSCGKSFRGVSLPYFLQVPVIDQVRNFFSQNGFFESLQCRFNDSGNGKVLRDITDGELYQDLCKNGGPLSKPENVSFLLNTDGAPVFKSSNISIWPLFLTINELEFKQRMLPENLILAGLWFDSKKPSMGTFLEPLLEEFKQMGNGVKCFSPTKGNFISKGFLLSSTADLPARALLCNCVQYNGSYSCWKCLQKGETASRGSGHTHIFPFLEHDPKGPARTTQNALEDADMALRSNTENFSVHGIKGPSWLSFCPKFDFVGGMAIDYMHGVLLGVQKLLIRLWFFKEFSTKPFSVFSKLKIVDQRLLNIRPTLDISRLPRSIESDFKYWKASEFQNFLLFYSVPIMKDVLEKEYWLHYSLLVHAIFILLKDGITLSDLQKADTMLIVFCHRFSELYDRSFMTLNLHQLLHLTDNVRNLGPLYTHSCFPFEDKNGIILKMIQGTQNIDQQIVKGVSFLQKIPELKQSCIAKDSYLEQLCKSIEYPNSLKRKQEIENGVFILGRIVGRKLSENEQSAYENFMGTMLRNDTCQTFNRVDFNGQMIYGTEYSRMKKRDNSTVLYHHENVEYFGRVKFFIFTGIETNALAVISCLEYIASDLKVDHITQVTSSNDVRVIPIKNILRLCMVVAFDEETYVCQFPNSLQFD